MVIPLGDTEPARIFPVATYGLIALNVVLYLVQIAQGPNFTIAYSATPWEITHGVDLPSVEELLRSGMQPEELPPALVALEHGGVTQSSIPFPVWFTLFSSMFLHGSPLHLAGNMLYLWIFGDNVEEVLGTVRYLLAYLFSGLMGSLLQIVSAPDSLIPTLGASGAIAGVMGMYLVWFPRNRIRLLLIRVVVEVQAIWVIGSWIAIQLFRGFASLGALGESGGVAYLAHVGGAVAGATIGFLCRDRALAQKAAYPPAWDRRRFDGPSPRPPWRR